MIRSSSTKKLSIKLFNQFTLIKLICILLKTKNIQAKKYLYLKNQILKILTKGSFIYMNINLKGLILKVCKIYKSLLNIDSFLDSSYLLW